MCRLRFQLEEGQAHLNLFAVNSAAKVQNSTNTRSGAIKGLKCKITPDNPAAKYWDQQIINIYFQNISSNSVYVNFYGFPWEIFVRIVDIKGNILTKENDYWAGLPNFIRIRCVPPNPTPLPRVEDFVEIKSGRLITKQLTISYDFLTNEAKRILPLKRGKYILTISYPSIAYSDRKIQSLSEIPRFQRGGHVMSNELIVTIRE